jgi:CheY-like chemotaxis protein
MAVGVAKKRVGIVDDNAEHRAGLSRRARLAGFDPVPFEAQYSSVQELVETIKGANVYGVLCDHRLQEGNYAGFYGAEAVAALYDAIVPALLVTDYSAVDADGTIRRFRRRIPVVMSTAEVDPDAIVFALEYCDREVRRQEVPLSRRPRRSIVLIDDIREGPTGKQVIAFVPQWKADQAVSFPLTLVPEALQGHLKHDGMLLASVNVDAEAGDELFFENFELPPKEGAGK